MLFVRFCRRPRLDLKRGYSYNGTCFGDESEAHAGLCGYACVPETIDLALEALSAYFGSVVCRKFRSSSPVGHSTTIGEANARSGSAAKRPHPAVLDREQSGRRQGRGFWRRARAASTDGWRRATSCAQPAGHRRDESGGSCSRADGGVCCGCRAQRGARRKARALHARL